MPEQTTDSLRITLVPINNRARVLRGEHILADSCEVIRLEERGYPPRLYFPWADVDERLLQLSDKTTHCPFKGDTRYFHLVLGEQHLADAAWCYPAPIDTMQAIAGHVAFDHALLHLDAPDG